MLHDTLRSFAGVSIPISFSLVCTYLTWVNEFVCFLLHDESCVASMCGYHYVQFKFINSWVITTKLFVSHEWHGVVVDHGQLPCVLVGPWVLHNYLVPSIWFTETLSHPCSERGQCYKSLCTSVSSDSSVLHLHHASNLLGWTWKPYAPKPSVVFLMWYIFS